MTDFARPGENYPYMGPWAIFFLHNLCWADPDTRLQLDGGETTGIPETKNRSFWDIWCSIPSPLEMYIHTGRIKKPTFVSSAHLVQQFWFPQWYFILLFLVSDNHCLARDLDYNLSTSKFNSFFKLVRKEEGIYSGAPPCSVCKYGLFTENSPRIGCLLSQ